ncbi:MAG: hypothetical protein PVJ84_17090 [Desulfobacteraceae bacterium]
MTHIPNKGEQMVRYYGLLLEQMAMFFLSLQVCSKSPNTRIPNLFARCAQPDRTYSMLYVLSG